MSGNWRDYLELGVGVARRMGAGSLTLDLRLQAFGKPKSANWPIAEATGGQSLLLGLGYEWACADAGPTSRQISSSWA